MSFPRRTFLDDDEDEEEEEDHNWRSLGRNLTTTRRNGVSKTTNDSLGEIRAIIQDEWAETLQPDFRPIGLALDMVDTSSLGRRRDLERFKRTNQDIERALQSTVNEHYQGFNSSIGTYGQVTSSIAASQKQVGATRDALHRAKAQLSTQRADLLDLSERSQQYNDMIALLKDIARLRDIPEQVEAHLSSKQFLKSVQCFNEANAIAHRQEMLNISALADIRQYLKSQSVSLVEILLEELHNHLYLKSPYCDSRWSSYTSGQTDLPIPSLDGRQSLRLPLEEHRSRRQANQHAIDRHPERDSFTYISTVLEALYIFGKLPYAMDVVAQRIPGQMHTLFETTVDQVRARHGAKMATPGKLDLADLLDRDDESAEPLRDLFWTLFSKVDAMLQAHSNLCETLLSLRDRFGGRAAVGSAVEYDFAEVWKPLGSELRSLFGQYIFDKSETLDSAKQSNVNANVFREPGRNKTKQVFDFMSQTARSESLSHVEEEQLRSMLHDSVPGLLADGADARNSTALQSSDAVGPIAVSTPFNVAVIMAPTVSLLNRAKRIIPPGSSVSPIAIDAFLDELIAKLVAPQLTELIDDATRSALNGSLRPAHETTHGAPSDLVDFLMVLARFSTLFEQIGYKRESYADMMIGAIQTYFTKVQGQLSACTASAQQDTPRLGSLKIGPAWATRQETRQIWQPFLLENYFNASKLYAIAAQEQDLIRQLRAQLEIRKADLINDLRSIQSMASLLGTIKAFMAALRRLHPETEVQVSWLNGSKDDTALHAQLKKLEMSAAGATKFDSLMAALQRFLFDILLTLRLELRVQVLFFVRQSLTHGNFDSDEPAVEVDPIILDLIKQIDVFNEVSVQHLAPDEVEFVLAGLGPFIDELFVDECELIGILSAPGAQKVGLHILAIQQHLRNLVPSPELADLGPSKLFYDLFEASPLGLIEVANSSGGLPFPYDQAAKLLKLQHSRDLQQGQRGVQNGTNRSSKDGSRRKLLDEHLILLSEAMWKVDQVGGGQ